MTEHVTTSSTDQQEAAERQSIRGDGPLEKALIRVKVFLDCW